MNFAAMDSGPDLRRAARHRASYNSVIEHVGGETRIHIANVSAHGFMIDDHDGKLQRGDRVSVRLPVIGRIEAYLVWAMDSRAGFQFERIIRLPDFLAMLEQVGPKRG